MYVRILRSCNQSLAYKWAQNPEVHISHKQLVGKDLHIVSEMYSKNKLKQMFKNDVLT